ncbi:MAG: CRISPR-associated helicase Cas3' [Sandaracinaceae bacterium]
MEGEVGVWGKLRLDAGVAVAWHPLVDHCLDVAACAEALLERSLLGARLSGLARRESLTPVDRARLVVLAALHDLGKMNRGFQNRGTGGFPQAGHVDEASWLLQSSEGQAVLAPLAAWGDAAYGLLFAAISHHGRPAAVSTAECKSLWEGEPLSRLADFLERLRELVPRAFEDGPPMPDAIALEHGFAGLVMLADWLGSDTRFFRYSEAGDPPRLGFARTQAARALDAIGIATELARSRLSEGIDFARAAGFAANAMQRSVLDLPVRSGPGLTFLESDTGSGKTEAAFARFLGLHRAGEVDGMYFALPTRTAATQLFRRMRGLIQRTYGEDAPPVVLAVPGYLQVDDEVGQRLPGFEVLWNDDPVSRMRYRGWAAENPKRYLAGAIVVGTIDQVLLGGLQTGHAHLRITALTRQLLVVDEVHASDTYMTYLLRNVLALHVAAGGHALLMSATLEGEARVALARVVLKLPVPAFEEASEERYPRVSVVEPAGEHVVYPNEGGRPKDVRWEATPIANDATEIARRACDAARRGAKVLVIRNTVRDCLETQRALEAVAPELSLRCGGVPVPHHSRYATPDRIRLDAAIEAAIGKGSSAGGVVAVATQTVQQSLDLCADWLMTDLCPVDVLLQRLGRLHRHARARPPGFERARAVVLTPESRDLTPLVQPDGSARGPHGLGTVYPDLRALETTWRLVESQLAFRTPDANRELVERALHPSRLSGIEKQHETFERHARAVVGRALADRGLAGLNALDWRKSVVDTRFPSDRRTPTRLGEDDRRIGLEPPIRSALGERITELKLTHWMVHGLSLDDEAAVEPEPDATESGAFTFSLAGARFSYSRLGLEKMD